MCGVQTCKRRSSHSTQDYHSIKFRLLLVTLGGGGSVTAFRLLCCVVMCLLRLALFVNVFPRQYCWEHWSIRSDPAPHVNLRTSLSQDRQWWLACVTQIIVIHIAVQLNPHLTLRHPDNPH